MSVRLVVCFRSPEVLSDPETYLRAARALSERAQALGGRLIAWGATLYAFEFEPDAIEDAIELSLSVARDADAVGEHGVGVSEGELFTGDEATAKIPLTWGYPLVAGAAFARAAGAGEVLLDANLGALKRGDILAAGSRVIMYGELRLRALVLDGRHPLRTPFDETAPNLTRPEFIGRPELSDLYLPAGSLGILRAARGAGGTRFLEELERELEPMRILRLVPGPFGEPLGSLRRALGVVVADGESAPGLESAREGSLGALLGGEGLDVESAARIISAFVATESANQPTGIVIVDDAGEIDVDSLDAVARAALGSAEPFRVLIRLGETDPIPEALASLDVGAEVLLGPLSAEDAALVAVRSLRGELDEQVGSRWATRGGCLPLGVVESVRDAVETTDIVWEDGRASARLPTSGTGGPRPAKYWIARRLANLDGSERQVLEALAVLGGSAEAGELARVVFRRTRLQFDADPALLALETKAWLERRPSDVVALPSATHREAVLSSLSDLDFAAWHAAAAAALGGSDSGLRAAAIASHALLGGDVREAIAAARTAAAVAQAASLSATAEAYERFAASQNVELLTRRRLFSSQLELARSVSSVWPDASPSSVRPGSGPPRPPSDRATTPSSRAVEALRNGDAETVERMANQLRVDEGRLELAARLEAMAKLSRGETGDAIRRLRDASDAARKNESGDRCRASLALGVALATANRAEEALLEALDALARARELHDSRGERACTRFLSQLSAIAGHPDVAEAWAALST
jgi:hypothetical protein